MLAYWALYGSAALASLLNNRAFDRHRTHPILMALVLAIILMVGMRYRVGADWLNYLSIYNWVGKMSFDRAIASGDVAYQALNWLGQEWNLRIWFVNLACAIAFGVGLSRFATLFQNPYLAIAVAIPYVVFAVAMGYTRQGAALGFVMAALAEFIRRGNIVVASGLILAGSLFHSSAVAVFPLIAMTRDRSRIVNLLVVAAASFIAYQAFSQSGVEKIRNVYLNTSYASQGAMVRVLMDISAAALFAVLRQRLAISYTEYKIWRNFSLASLTAFVALFLVNSSAVVDRLALYLLPLQIAMFARMVEVGERRLSAVAFVLALFALVLFVWLNYGANSGAWVPYGAFFVTV